MVLIVGELSEALPPRRHTISPGATSEAHAAEDANSPHPDTHDPGSRPEPADGDSCQGHRHATSVTEATLAVGDRLTGRGSLSSMHVGTAQVRRRPRTARRTEKRSDLDA